MRQKIFKAKCSSYLSCLHTSAFNSISSMEQFYDLLAVEFRIRIRIIWNFSDILNFIWKTVLNCYSVIVIINFFVSWTLCSTHQNYHLFVLIARFYISKPPHVSIICKSHLSVLLVAQSSICLYMQLFVYSKRRTYSVLQSKWRQPNNLFISYAIIRDVLVSHSQRFRTRSNSRPS